MIEYKWCRKFHKGHFIEEDVWIIHLSNFYLSQKQVTNMCICMVCICICTCDMSYVTSQIRV